MGVVIVVAVAAAAVLDIPDSFAAVRESMEPRLFLLLCCHYYFYCCISLPPHTGEACVSMMVEAGARDGL